MSESDKISQVLDILKKFNIQSVFYNIACYSVKVVLLRKISLGWFLKAAFRWHML